jgi:transcriptional regulator with XRE-family HTH domain
MDIKTVRENAGLTQAELAEKIGVAQQIVSRWEKGDRKPKLEALEKISEACNVKLSALLTDHSSKLSRARNESGYAAYGSTCAAIFEQIPYKLIDSLTAGQLAVIAQIIDKAYQSGKASMGAEVIDGDYLWVDALDAGYDLNILRKLRKEETRTERKVSYDGNLNIVTNDYYYNNAISQNTPMHLKDKTQQRTSRQMQQVPRAEWINWEKTIYETVEKWTLED